MFGVQNYTENGKVLLRLIHLARCKKENKKNPVSRFSGKRDFLLRRGGEKRDYFLLLRLRAIPARPIRPVPKRSIVAGSGTGAVPLPIRLSLPQPIVKWK